MISFRVRLRAGRWVGEVVQRPAACVAVSWLWRTCVSTSTYRLLNPLATYGLPAASPPPGEGDVRPTGRQRAALTIHQAVTGAVIAIEVWLSQERIVRRLRVTEEDLVALSRVDNGALAWAMDCALKAGSQQSESVTDSHIAGTTSHT